MSLQPLADIVMGFASGLSIIKWILFAAIVLAVLWIMSNFKLGSGGSSKAAMESRTLRDLVKSAAQWAARSMQDSAPVIAVMNANYAMAYLNMARALATDAEIESNAGVPIDALIRDIEAAQSAAIQRLSAGCPSVGPQGLAAMHSGWLSKGT